ncbi:MAG: DNA-processing protein DprA [Christensenellales bacterium]|nr:DNA-processing protein DprA [Christensenellales bacterium]
MAYSADAFATMLLTMAITPNREEYVRPYGTAEFRRLEEAVKGSKYNGVGELMGVDISGLMIHLGITEEEGYRIFALLNRSVHLGYAMEKFMNSGIDVLTVYNDEYPACIKNKMGETAPPVIYQAGNPTLLGTPALAIMGISGVRTTPEVRKGIAAIVSDAVAHGYGLITGGELGVSNVVASAVAEQGGKLIDVVGGDMLNHLSREPIAQLLESGQMAVVSMEHPEAFLTISHALSRNKILFALSEAALIVNTDNKRGEIEALNNRSCNWIYAWTGCPDNMTLIGRGATPVEDLSEFNFQEKARVWKNSRSEQMSMFDFLM